MWISMDSLRIPGGEGIRHFSDPKWLFRFTAAHWCGANPVASVLWRVNPWEPPTFPFVSFSLSWTISLIFPMLLSPFPFPFPFPFPSRRTLVQSRTADASLPPLCNLTRQGLPAMPKLPPRRPLLGLSREYDEEYPQDRNSETHEPDQDQQAGSKRKRTPSTAPRERKKVTRACDSCKA
jgi:hypothetical protein